MTAPPAHVDVPTTVFALDLQGLIITTAIASAIHEALEPLAQGDGLEVTIGAAPALIPDLEAWTRQSGHRLEVVEGNAVGWRLRITKGQAERSGHRVAIVISQGGLEELLSPLGFALAAALEGATVSVYIQGPAVRILRPGWSATLPWPMRPFTRFARKGLEAAGHVAAIEKLRQLRSLGGRVYACGPSLAHFGVNPHDLALPDVIVCEYLTVMTVMQEGRRPTLSVAHLISAPTRSPDSDDWGLGRAIAPRAGTRTSVRSTASQPSARRTLRRPPLAGGRRPLGAVLLCQLAIPGARGQEPDGPANATAGGRKWRLPAWAGSIHTHCGVVTT